MRVCAYLYLIFVHLYIYSSVPYVVFLGDSGRSSIIYLFRCSNLTKNHFSLPLSQLIYTNDQVDLDLNGGLDCANLSKMRVRESEREREGGREGGKEGGRRHTRC